MLKMLNDVFEYLSQGNNNNNNIANDLPPTTTVVNAAPSSTTSPASDPTGTPPSVSTIEYFTEIAIPSPTPSGV